MPIQFLILLGSLLVLFAGAEGLVRGSASLALRLGLTPLVVGLTVVAFGTSAPELVVSLNAALSGRGDIAVGNIVGSNIFNIGIILGITALICPIKVSLPVLRLDAPLMVGATLLVTLFLLDGSISSPLGFGLLASLIAYSSFTVWMARTETAAGVEAEFEEANPGKSKFILLDVAFILGGFVLLIVGSRLLVDSASTIARAYGVSEAIIGLTIIAAGTSMPELATSLLAAVRRQPDIAIGNVIGSNLFNVLGILGSAAAVRAITAPGIQTSDLVVMCAFAVALLPLMFTGRSLQRWEGGLLLVGYAAYLAAILPANESNP